MAYQAYLEPVDVKGTLKSSVAPSTSQHLATKGYVDESIAAGGGDWLASVKEQLAAPPGSPSSGDRYLIAATGTGAWSGKDNQVAEYDGSAWVYTSPSEGMHVFVEGGSGALGADIVAVYSGSAWVKGASLNGALVASNNLSDVGSASAARSNLGPWNLVSEVTGTLAIANGGTAGATATAAFDNLSPMTAAADLIVGGSSGTRGRLAVGSAGQVLKVASGGTTLEWGSSGGSGTVTSIALKGDDDSSTTAVTASGAIDVDGGAAVTGGTNPIQTSVSGGALVVSPRIASSSATGIASFSSDNFDVSGTGIVTIKDAGVDLTAEVTGTLPAANGGTGLTSISTLLNSNVTPTSLGLVIGTNVQAADAGLTSIAGLTTAADKMVYTTALDTYAVTGLTALARSLLDDDNPTTMQSTLGLGSAATKTVATAVGSTAGKVLEVKSGTNLADGNILAVDSDGKIVAGSASSGTVTSIALSDNQGDPTTAVTSSGTIGVSGTGAITTNVIGSGALEISVANAGSSTKGVASFSDNAFTSSSGAITFTPQNPLPYPGFIDSSNATRAIYTSAQSKTLGFYDNLASAESELQVFNFASGAVSSASTVVLPVPQAAHLGRSFEVKVMANMSSTNKVTISVAGSHSGKMDGSTSIDLDQDFQRLRFTAISASTSSGAINYAIG